MVQNKKNGIKFAYIKSIINNKFKIALFIKNIIKLFIVAMAATVYLTACDKKDYVYYIVEGRLIDKSTGEPIESIMVSFNKYDIVYPRDGQKIQKRSPVEHDGCSNENGEFRVLETYRTSRLCIYDNYGRGYKDTTVSIDFSKVPLSGKPSRDYKGEYILNVGDIELELQ